MSDADLDIGFVEAMGDERGLSMLAELGEFTLDQFLGEGVLRDAPVVGGLFGLLKVGRSIRDYIFARKIAVFLVSLHSIDPTERMRFANEAEIDQKQQKRVGSTIMMLLDRHADLQKSKLLAHLFAEYLRGGIGYERFLRLADCVDRCMVADLRALVAIRDSAAKLANTNPAIFRFTESKIAEQLEMGASAEAIFGFLSGAGLIELIAIPSIRGEGAENVYSMTKLGTDMVRAVSKVQWEAV